MKLFKTRKDKQIEAIKKDRDDLFNVFLEAVTMVEEAHAIADYWEELADYLGDYLEETYDEDVIKLINDWERDKQ